MKCCVLGAPTNFGRSAIQKTKWDHQLDEMTRGDFNTTYTTSYTPNSADSFVTRRFATERAQSTSLNSFNKVNKDLNLRNATLLRSPENMQKPVMAANC